MLFFRKPSETAVGEFLQEEKDLPFSYAEVHGTQEGVKVSGFDNDYNSVELGAGDEVWEAAKEAIRQWKMFPGGWAEISSHDTPIEAGRVVAMQARVLGLWWLNSCRIVYMVDENSRFGFAYGTLPGHVECGEELFMVEKLADGRVQYVLKAFSRPRFWAAHLAYPIARAYQRKFVRDSKASMKQFVNEHSFKNL